MSDKSYDETLIAIRQISDKLSTILLNMRQAHKPAPTEEGTDGTSGGCPSATADGPLGTSPHSSPLPVSQNRFYPKQCGACRKCHKEFVDSKLDIMETVIRYL